MPVVVKCKECGNIHASAIQWGDKESFYKAAPNSIMSSNSEQCPKCGKMSTHSNTDYSFQD